MSVLSQELLQKTSNHSSAETRTSVKPQKQFKEVLKTEPCDEEPHRRDLFSLVTTDEEEEESVASAYALPPPLCPITADVTIIQSAPVALPVQQGVEALFEKMASCMLVMSTSHEQETTLVLDSPNFASSSFFGTQITIREFSTAPKAFNIEILANPLALTMINASKNDLLTAFQRSNFNFTVHRLETHLEQTEQRPLFHRKERDDKGESGEQGESS